MFLPKPVSYVPGCQVWGFVRSKLIAPPSYSAQYFAIRKLRFRILSRLITWTLIHWLRNKFRSFRAVIDNNYLLSMPPHLRKTFIQILPLRQSGDCRFLLLRRVVVLFTPFSFYNFQIFRLQRNEMLCFLMRPLVLPKLLPGTAMMYDRPLFLFSSFVFMTLTSYRSSKGRRNRFSSERFSGWIT